MKKFLSLILTAALLLSLQIFPTAHADEYSDLCQALVNSCKNNTQVDISRFGLNEDSLDAAFVDVWYSGKLPWNVSSYSYTINSNGVLLSFSPMYYDQAEYDYTRYEQAVAELMDQVIFEGMNQWQMALAVHDYLIANSTYDESLERNTNYDLLVNGTAVCSGYAMAYLDIMNRLGVECRFVESQSMLHAWNLIKIDGNWYHVDLTHDDPTPDCYGTVMHTRFLKTDAEMEELGYRDWNTTISCTDETFTDPMWADVNSMICFQDADSYFLRCKDEWDYTIAHQSDTQQVLYDIPAQGLTLEGDDTYHYEHNGLSLWNGRLWFSDVDRVYSMLPDGSDVQTVFRYDIEENKKFIYGSFVNNGILYLTLSDVQYGFTTQTVPLEDSDYHVHSYTETPLGNVCTGGMAYVCDCGLRYETDSIPGQGHNYEAYITQQATCQEDGVKKFICSACNDSYTEPYSDSSAHRYESIVIKEASFFREGQRHVTCLICGYSAYESLPRLSFQKQFGLTVWSTLSVIVLLIVMPILIGAGKKKKNRNN